jgi:hypothetical protein
MRVFENRVLRRISRPKRDEVTGEMRIPHDKELYALFLTKYYSGHQIKKNNMGKAYSTYGGEDRCIQGFSGDT